MIDILRNIILSPIQMIFEIIYSVSYIKITKSAGLSIFVLSFVLNILLMPLYKKADEIQNEENEIFSKMKPDIDFIKKAFKGDEQYLILQTYYRQHNYKPIYALRNSVSLLLQIPFFMAAYSFLSNLSIIKQSSFGPISDLGAPDGLLFGLNLLPILMTATNVISTIIYTKGSPLKSKIQLYLMALFFLVLLWNAPSGLSLYYLLNNVFSLIKNILDKLKHKKKIIAFLMCFSSILFGIWSTTLDISGKGKTIIVVFCLLLIVVSYMIYIDKKIELEKTSIIFNNKYFFFLTTVFMSVLMGLTIPSSVISSSVEDFVGLITYINPNSYILKGALTFFGLFVLWFNVFYFLVDNKVKPIINVLMFSVCVISLVDYLVINTGFGVMSRELIYEKIPNYPTYMHIVNLIIIIFVLLLTYFIYKKNSNILKYTIIILTIASISMSIVNINQINSETETAFNKIGKYEDSNVQIISLSKSGKNTIVIMLDRAISLYFPYLLNEKPILQEQFKGFTFYPNTISFGCFTNTGSPALFGGYEYTPEEMNKRSNLSLSEKHNQALKLMPTLFSRESYETIILDPPYAGYSIIPDLSIFNNMGDNVKPYITCAKYSDVTNDRIDGLEDNIMLYSISKISPSFVHNLIYDGGKYLKLGTEENKEEIVSNDFTEWYDVLTHLPYMTRFTDDKGSFIMMQNETTHNPHFLLEPDYIPSGSVNDEMAKGMVKEIQALFSNDELILENSTQIIHYQANMAAMLQLGKYFDYLRENNVYDNTRIIIVSDHGRDLNCKKDLLIHNDDMMMYSALLLVKDFNNNEEVFVDESFMTNADVPYLAMNGVIHNMINPFTNKEIKKEVKENKEYNVFSTKIFSILKNNGYTFLEDKWYSVQNDWRNPNNWEIIEDPSN